MIYAHIQPPQIKQTCRVTLNTSNLQEESQCTLTHIHNVCIRNCNVLKKMPSTWLKTASKIKRFFFIWKVDNFAYEKCRVAIFKC